ncbi:muramoyltetrapeptide carboxypeptidase [Erwinia sp. INIA-01]|uniref:muramoyltetrapeptide carboxypeptidase n=1 Tax=Erwinia sp. INIA01 TaxID=2991500 RepID=UPI002224C91E|nr:muramoyltetrapeptide carboxypeptidase [Erwinia sp. INIA01]MCW1874485.1 muramoyltetrapeptide carboxypeptidase [Erwinia sp. INIA01]
MTVSPRNIHLIAPSGFCHNPDAAQRGIDRLRADGHRVTHTDIISRREQRFAGSDSQRLADVNDLARLETLPDIVLAVRGGYGASRLLPNLDYKSLADRLCGRPVALCGHSDFTAIQLALLAQAGLQSFSGPMLTGNFGAETLSDFTLNNFWLALTSAQFTLRWQTTPQQLSTSGTLWGGNLAMIASLIGTPWLPDIRDGILVIEDVNEHPFRVERMLLQLLESGILARQKAIVTGSFTGNTLSDYDNGYDFSSVWELIAQRSGLPLVTGLDFGHGHDTVTLPLGARAELNVNGSDAALTISGHTILGSSPANQ